MMFPALTLTYWLTLHGMVTVIAVLIYVIASHVLQHRRHPTAAIAWVLFILLLPYVALPSFLAFGSRKLGVVELSVSHLAYVPDEIQRDVLAFDWWIRNDDRTLSESGGNPNLFWDVSSEKLVVIDHNQAFDDGFAVENFSNLHVFHGQINALSADWVMQQHYRKRFLEVLADWDVICNTVPPEWWFIDAEQTIPTDFDRDATQQLLLRCQNDEFWKMI